MNLHGKKLKNLKLALRYAIRAVKNLIFLLQARKTPCSKTHGAVVIIYKEHVPRYWFVGDPGLKDRLAYKILKQHGFETRVVFDPTLDEIDSFPEKLIWFNPHHFVFGSHRQSDGVHSQNLSLLIKHMEKRDRKVIPTSNDILFWENKIYMHQCMKEKELRHPKSRIYEKLDFIHYREIADEFGLPFLIKSPDGYSSNGLMLIRSEEDFLNFAPRENIIIQEFLNITMDLRLIMVDGITESFYWRKNPKTNEWKPTATSGGATVQFYGLPQSAERLGRDIYELYGVHTFGADICWRNDDLGTDPYVLEFSPIYQPNPIPAEKVVSKRYSDFKERTVLKYDLAFERLVSDLFSKQLLRIRAGLKEY